MHARRVTIFSEHSTDDQGMPHGRSTLRFLASGRCKLEKVVSDVQSTCRSWAGLPKRCPAFMNAIRSLSAEGLENPPAQVDIGGKMVDVPITRSLGLFLSRGRRKGRGRHDRGRDRNDPDFCLITSATNVPISSHPFSASMMMNREGSSAARASNSPAPLQAHRPVSKCSICRFPESRRLRRHRTTRRNVRSGIKVHPS